MDITLVIRNGLVHDGLGSPPVRADVAIAGDRIAAVGVVDDVDVPTIDATGLVVCPGFINVLSHAWGTIQVEGDGRSDLLQGVTTEVFGEAYSLGPSSPAIVKLMHQRKVPDGVRVDFPRLSDGLDHLESKGVSTNVASFIGGTNLRALAAGPDNRPLTSAEIAELRDLVDEEMANGALGIGTALIYAPGNYATTDELVALCEVVGEHDGLYISHMRSEGDQLLECLDELLEIGERARCRVEAYHLKAAGSYNHHKMAEAIARIEKARADGQEVTADMYPYTAGGTALAASIPPEFHDGGMTALLARLQDPSIRERIRTALGSRSDGFENLFLGSSEGRGVLFLGDMQDGTATAGRYLPEVAAMLGIDDLAEALLEVVSRDHTMLVCYFMMSEENVQLGLSQPWVSIGSDAGAFADDSPAAAGPTHPRTFGTFARVLGHYSRDLGLFPLEEAIRKMTSSPADTLRLADRGRLTPGAFADVAVFDATTVIDRATFESSTTYAEGMRHVVVNGVPVVVDGQVLETRPGRRLRRGISR